MTAMERLRELLDERGIAWDEYGDGYTIWSSERCVHTAHPNVKDNLIVTNVTPEQAIAATLGRGTCRNVHEPPKDTTFWPSPHFKCSECGATHVSMEYVFYCPNCGRRVVDE